MVEPATPVRIYALGGFRLLVDGRELRLRTRKEATLLLRLAVAGDAGLTRDECVALLWPESSEARARHSLSEALRGIEQATRVVILRTPERLRLEEGALSLDVRELEQAMATGDVDACARLWLGGFLAGWYPPTAEASHWVDAYGALLANRLERTLRAQLASRRQATDSRGVSACVELLEKLGVATDADRDAAAEAEQITGWESLRPGESIQPRIPIDREGPFVGRVEEMKLLTAELERALAGELRVVLVSGEPGIGKTRTCQRLARLAAIRGARLFMSKCYELEQSVPFGALGEALRGSIRPVDLAELRPLWREAIVAAVPDLSPEEESPQPSDSGILLTSQATHIAFSAMFSSVLHDQAGFLLIDDVQWADATSCQVIHYMIRASAPQSGLCVVLAYRDDSLNQNPSAKALIRSLDAMGSTSLVLQPMAHGEIRTQLQGLWSAPLPVIDAVSTVSGGNPFFARELALADANSVSSIPLESLSGVILSRAEGLLEHERFILDVVAVAGSPIGIRDLARATELGVSKIVSAVKNLERLRLIAESGSTIAIAHDLTRQAFYAALPPAVRRSLHAAVALSVEIAPAAFRAHHYAEAALNKEAHIFALEAASESRARRAFWEEAEWLLEALRLQDGDRALLETVVSRLFALARYSEAVAVIEASRERLHPSLLIKASLGRLKALPSSSPEFQGAMAKCDAVFEAAVSAGLGYEAIEALREKMRFSQEIADIDSILSIAEQLHEFGCSSDDQALRAHAVAVSLMKLATVRPEVVRDRYDDLMRSIDHELPNKTQVSIGMVNALDLYNQGKISDAGCCYHSLIRGTRTTGDLGEEVRFRSLLVPISTEGARFGRAIRHGAFVLEYSRLADARWERLMTLLNLAASCLEAGDLARSKEFANEGLVAARDYPSWRLTTHTAYAILGLCAYEVGDHREAGEYARRIEEQLPPVDEWLGDTSPLVSLMLKTRVQQRKTSEAAEFLRTALAHRRAPRVYQWATTLEGVRLRLYEAREGGVLTVSIRDAAMAVGCRLIERKAAALLKRE